MINSTFFSLRVYFVTFLIIQWIAWHLDHYSSSIRCEQKPHEKNLNHENHKKRGENGNAWLSWLCNVLFAFLFIDFAIKIFQTFYNLTYDQIALDVDKTSFVFARVISVI